MGKKSSGGKSGTHEIHKYPEELRSLSRQILQIVNSGLTRTYFLRKISGLISEFFNAAQLKILLRVCNDPLRFEYIQYRKDTFQYNSLPRTNHNNSPHTSSDTELYDHWDYFLSDDSDKSLPLFTKKGSFFTGYYSGQNRNQRFLEQTGMLDYIMESKVNSLLVTPLLSDYDKIGIIELHSPDNKFLSEYDLEQVETFLQTLGITLMNQYTQSALQERVKELTCLYGMSQIAEQSFVSLKDLMHKIMNLLPPAWQYPEITRSRIILDGINYAVPDLKSEVNKLSSDIIIDARKRGSMEVIYIENRPELDEGPFLKEERKLLDLLVRELAHIIEKRESDDDKETLINQLHHTDRLATVGELAAGVAHELNEPLGNILGFAQLAAKNPYVPEQVKKDLDKIIKSSLHAREIINKLMFFSRLLPAAKEKIDLNTIVKDSLFFFKSRCYKDGIELITSLETNLPAIIADPVQINQVLINIIVNALQAMPGGGKLEIKTMLVKNEIILTIKDTGHGMNRDIQEQIFDPFFTTKKAGMGLGLGLSVVHSIISSCHGTIRVDSKPNEGTIFEIKLPVNHIQSE